MSSRLVFYVRHVDEVGHVHRVTVRSMSVALAMDFVEQLYGPALAMSAICRRLRRDKGVSS